MDIRFKERILELIKQYYKLLERQSDVNYSIYDDGYHTELYQNERLILSFFGLPEKPKYHLLLSNRAFFQDVKEREPERIFQTLSRKAERYLSARNKTSRHLLSMAKATKADPCEILPELKIPVHSYTLYLYNEIVLKNEALHDWVIREFEMLKKNVLADIYLLCFDNNYKNNPIYKNLSAIGLQFLDSFLEWYHGIKN